MFNYDIIENKIKQYLEEENEDITSYFDKGVSEEQIQSVEEFLSVTLPESYKWFLKKYGAGGINGFELFGIESGIDIKNCSLVTITEEYRKKGLHDNLVIIEYQGEYVTCLNTSNQEECNVVTWSLFDNDDIVQKEENFYVYFQEKLEDYL